jgi:1-acyl-sn-glycerol-3-phosphate acyltransferase
MSATAFIVNATIKNITRLICRVDDDQLKRIPERGPLILVTNHINFLEVPLIYTHLQPRPITGLAKAETWDNPVFRPLFNMWGAIPLRRGESDIRAIRLCLEALAQGNIIGIAPEGTRSRTGRLQQGLPGVVLIALQSGAPILPLVYYGNEQFRENIVRLKRTDFKIIVGQTFRITTNQMKISKELRRKITDEIMYQIAALLPPEYRGAYSDLSLATESYLTFEPPSISNLVFSKSLITTT